MYRDNQEKLRRALRQRDEDFSRLMAEEWGRRIVRLLLAEAGVWRGSFSPDAFQTAFNEGRRAQGLFLLDAVKHCDEFLLLMEREEDERNESGESGGGC